MVATLETSTATMYFSVTDDHRILVEIVTPPHHELIVLGRNDARTLMYILTTFDAHESAGRAPTTGALPDPTRDHRTLTATAKTSGDAFHDRFDLVELTIRLHGRVATRIMLDDVDRKGIIFRLTEAIESAYDATAF